ncbi:MAG: cytidylate kinase-like family protein [Candidatus Eisenbacteria bacterium]|nr:cytidylate kinase-like family protein [Candidatus Eisenbacteria bacterium]
MGRNDETPPEQKERECSGSEPVQGCPGGPLITISRDFSCGGGTVAKKLAARLGWNFYDRSLLDRIVAQRRGEGGGFDDLGEDAPEHLGDMARSIFESGYKGDKTYMRALVRALLDVSREGNAVLAGRGTNFLIPERRRLAIRLAAPTDWRIARYARVLETDLDKATDAVRQEDERRRRFCRENIDREISDPLAYDLVINMRSIDTNTVQLLILNALRSRFDLKETALPLSDSGIRPL